MSGSNFTNVVYERSFDVCKAFEGKSITRFVFVIFELFKKKTNASFKCPFPVGKYYVHDVDIGRLNLPPVLPIGPVKSIMKCNAVLTASVKDDRSVFLTEYDFYIKVIKR